MFPKGAHWGAEENFSQKKIKKKILQRKKNNKIFFLNKQKQTNKLKQTNKQTNNNGFYSNKQSKTKPTTNKRPSNER
jgi:hypothetical protein